MIKLERIISPTPIPVSSGLSFFQPTLQEIVDMGEDMYWSLLKLWDLDREEMIAQEDDYTKQLTDFEIWKTLMSNNEDVKIKFQATVDCFLHSRVEFLPLSNTIVIGENDSDKTIVDEAFYNTMKEIAHEISVLTSGEPEEAQFKETADMTPKQRELIRKMKEGAKRANEIKNKNKDTQNRLVNQIISLVAIGHYTFDEVYKLTYLQLIYLLKKYVSIQQYELTVSLSPYMDSKKTDGPKHWLD